MSAPLRIVVVGAGVFGTSAAWELARRGHAVRLLDPGPLPREEAATTDVSKALRLDYGSDEHYTRLMEEALPLWESWNAETPEPFFHPTGLLVLSGTPLAEGGFEAESYETVSRRGHMPERLDPGALWKRFPAIGRTRFAEAYYNPNGGWAESGRVIAWMHERAEATGVEIVQGASAEPFPEEAGAVRSVRLVTGETLPADRVLVAAGAWTPTLLPELAGRLRVVGQPLFHFVPDREDLYRPPRFAVWTGDVSVTGWYGFPLHPEGFVKLGNHGPGRSMLPDEPRVVVPAQEEAARDFLREAIPSLAEADLAFAKLCLYCDSPDGDFLIARHPDREGLSVATGGSGHAFKFAPVLGGIVADVMEGAGNPWSEWFRWDRVTGEGSAESSRAGEMQKGEPDD